MASRICSAVGSGMAFSSDALTATLALMQRRMRSAVSVARNAATTRSGTFGFLPMGRTMLRWFSTATRLEPREYARRHLGADQPPMTALSPWSAAPARKAGPPDWDRSGPRGSNQARWLRRVAFSTKRPSGVTASAHTTGTRPGFGSSCRTRLVAIPDQRTGADRVAPVGQPGSASYAAARQAACRRRTAWQGPRGIRHRRAAPACPVAASSIPADATVSTAHAAGAAAPPRWNTESATSCSTSSNSVGAALHQIDRDRWRMVAQQAPQTLRK